MKKNENGITIITLVIAIAIIILIAAVGITQGRQIISKANMQTLNTNMLLVQAKTKIIEERHSFDEENSYQGEQLSTITDNEKINKLKEDGIISETEENYDAYYVIRQSDIYELELNTITLNDAFFIVNYKTEEVIYSEGIKDLDGNTYYKLSELGNFN